jgi:hypothetical protein
MYKVQSTGYKVQSIKYKVQSTKYKVQSTEYKVQNTEYRVQRVLNTQHSTPNTILILITKNSTFIPSLSGLNTIPIPFSPLMLKFVGQEDQLLRKKTNKGEKMAVKSERGNINKDRRYLLAFYTFNPNTNIIFN